MKLHHLSFVPILIMILNSNNSWAQESQETRPTTQPITQMDVCNAATKVTHYALKIMPQKAPLPGRSQNNRKERQKNFSTLFKRLQSITSLSSDNIKASPPPLSLFIQELKTAMSSLQTLINSSTPSSRVDGDLYTQTLEAATEVSLLAALIARESCPPHTALGMGQFTSELKTHKLAPQTADSL